MISEFKREICEWKKIFLKTQKAYDEENLETMILTNRLGNNKLKVEDDDLSLLRNFFNNVFDRDI